jgi:alpha/beta superfamily hydrolase
MMKSLPPGLLVLVFLAGCSNQATGPTRHPEPSPGDRGTAQAVSLTTARVGFKTKLLRQVAARIPVEQPPPDLFRIVHYESPAGKLAAYLSPAPKQAGRQRAIIWIFGGFSNSIGGTAWRKAPPENDQSASAFRKAGLIMMYPSFRGGNDNPGWNEGFFGEVDDVLAAADYLARQDFIDPRRIYLGGHSTGGTLALLAAECSDRFRAVFSFGPVEDVTGYGEKNLPFDTSNPRECDLRAPAQWLEAIKSPTFVFEGVEGNIESLQEMARLSRNANIRFLSIRGANHFNILAPTTRLIAGKILRDEGPRCNLTFTEEEVSRPFAK